MNGVDPVACSAFLIGAFVLAGAIHTLWLRCPASHRFAVPLDGGLTFRGRPLFGPNKTVRGLMIMVPATGASFYVLARTVDVPELSGLWTLTPGDYALVGLWAGLGFMLGELPNSFAKRQLGISPGGPGAGLLRPVFAVIDRIDSIAGMLVALALVVPTPWQLWVYLLVVGPGIHLAFSALLFGLGVKARVA